MEFTIWIPGDLCGALIGDKGHYIRKLRSDHRIAVEVEYTEKGEGQGKLRRVVIGPGKPNTIRDVIADSFAAFMSNPPTGDKRGKNYQEMTFLVCLTHHEMGALIGKEGATVNAIRASSKTRIKVIKDTTGGRAEITGYLPDVRVAFDQLIKAICSESIPHANVSRSARAGSRRRSRSRRRSPSRRSHPRRRAHRSRSRSRGHRSRSRRNRATMPSRRAGSPLKNLPDDIKALSPSKLLGQLQPLVCVVSIPAEAVITGEQLQGFALVSTARIKQVGHGVEISGTPTQVMTAMSLLCKALQECGVIWVPAQA